MGPLFIREIYDQGRFNRNYVECLNTELRCQLLHSSRSFKISYIHKKYFSSSFRIFNSDIYTIIITKKSTFDLSDKCLIEFGNFDIKREKLWNYLWCNKGRVDCTFYWITKSFCQKHVYKTHFSKTLKPVKGMQ